MFPVCSLVEMTSFRGRRSSLSALLLSRSTLACSVRVQTREAEMKFELAMVLVVALGLSLTACSGADEAATADSTIQGVSESEKPAVAEVAAPGELAAEAVSDPVPVEPVAPKSGLQFELVGLENGGTIPDSMAFCIPAAEGHVTFGANTSPEMKWSQVPEGTKSFALVCHDSEAPTVGDDVNKEGKTIPKDLAPC